MFFAQLATINFGYLQNPAPSFMGKRKCLWHVRAVRATISRTRYQFALTCTDMHGHGAAFTLNLDGYIIKK